jgi:hypothetical protein
VGLEGRGEKGRHFPAFERLAGAGRVSVESDSLAGLLCGLGQDAALAEPWLQGIRAGNNKSD